METEKESSVKSQFEVADGKIATVQVDPECKEMSRLVTDLNRCVLRVQSHGQTAWEKEREKGRPRGFGVEVAHEATEDEAPQVGSGPFFAGADEPTEDTSTAVVQQYLENLERVEGKPGPVKRTLRRWLYGKRSSQAARGPGDSCCCRQVEAIAGKVTISEASDMEDEGINRLLIDVYFHPPPKQGLAKRAFRSASQMSKKVGERLKSAVGRMRHRRSEPHAGKTASTSEDAKEQAGAEAETVQLRPSSAAKGAGSPSDSGDDSPRSSGAKQGSRKQPEGGQELNRIAEEPESEQGSSRARGSSEDESQFHDARSSQPSADERDRHGEEQVHFQTGHNPGVYLVLLEAEDRDPHGTEQPQLVNFTPRKSNGSLGAFQQKEELIEDGERDRLSSCDVNELEECNHHPTVIEDNSEIRRVRRNVAKATLDADQNMSVYEHRNRYSLAAHANEKSKLPNRVSPSGEDSKNGGTHFKGERPKQRLEDRGQKQDLQSNGQNGTRRVVGKLQMFVMRGSTDFDCDISNFDISEEVTLASHHIGELEFDEDSLQNDEDHKSGASRPKEEQKINEQPEIEEENTQNVESCSTSKPVVKKGRRTV